MDVNCCFEEYLQENKLNIAAKTAEVYPYVLEKVYVDVRIFVKVEIFYVGN